MRFEDAQFSVQREVDSEGDFESISGGLESGDFGFEWEAPSAYAYEEEGGGAPPPGKESSAERKCRIEWFAKVEKYPEPLRSAIANAPADTISLYWRAVEHGMRGDQELTRLLYYAVYGSTYGYCPPRTAAARAAWAQTVGSLKVFKKRPQPPLAQTGPDTCGKQKGMKFPADLPALDITGRYYTVHPHATYVFNQAGLHIEGFASRSIAAGQRPGGAYRPLTEIQGELKDGKYYQWFNRDNPSHFGTIRERGGHFFLGNEWLRPLEKRATLIGSAYKPPIGDRDLTLVERHELTPLTPVQMQFIDKILDKRILDQIF